MIGTGGRSEGKKNPRLDFVGRERLRQLKRKIGARPSAGSLGEKVTEEGRISWRKNKGKASGAVADRQTDITGNLVRIRVHRVQRFAAAKG